MMSDIDMRIRKAYWSGHSDAMYKRDREQDRLRKALKKITQFDEPPHRIDVNNAYGVAIGAVKIARDVLKKEKENT